MSGGDFATRVASSTSVKTLARAMMLFSKAFPGDNKVALDLIDEEGVAVHFGAPVGSENGGHERFLELLSQTERLVFLENVIEGVRSGSLPLIDTDKLVEEAMSIAKTLYPNMEKESG